MRCMPSFLPIVTVIRRWPERRCRTPNLCSGAGQPSGTMTLHKPTPRVPIPQAAAGCTAFAAFSVSIIVGVSAGNPTETVLVRALLAMLMGCGFGFAVGLVCDWLVAQEVARLESIVEEDTREIEAVAATRTPEAVEVFDEEALGVVEERAPRRKPADEEDAEIDSQKNAA